MTAFFEHGAETRNGTRARKPRVMLLRCSQAIISDGKTYPDYLSLSWKFAATFEGGKREKLRPKRASQRDDALFVELN